MSASSNPALDGLHFVHTRMAARTPLAAAACFLLVFFACVGRVAGADGFYDATWPSIGGGGYLSFDGDYANAIANSFVLSIEPEANGNVKLAGQFIYSQLQQSWWLGELDARGAFVPSFGLDDGSGRTNGCSMAGLCSGYYSFPFSAIALSNGSHLVLDRDMLARTTSGAHALDKNIAVDHLVVSDVQGYVTGRSLLALPGDTWLVAGTGRIVPESNDDFGAARLTSALVLDTSFNNATVDGHSYAGGAVYPLDSSTSISRADAAVLQPDGHVVLVGLTTSDTSEGGNLALLRIEQNGAVDVSWAVAGRQILSWPGKSADLVYQLNPIVDRTGRIIVPMYAKSAGEMLIARVTKTGTQDFFTAVPASAFPTSPCVALWARAAAIDSAGRILVAGQCGGTSRNYFAVVRLRGDTGALDTSFGIDGLSYGWFDPASSLDAAEAIAFDASGRPLIGGYTFADESSEKAGVARLEYDLIFTADNELAPRGCLPPDCN